MARPAAWSLGTLVMRGVPFKRLFFMEYPIMGTNVFKKLCKFIGTRGKVQILSTFEILQEISLRSLFQVLGQ